MHCLTDDLLIWIAAIVELLLSDRLHLPTLPGAAKSILTAG
jgi:hypothetical protein